MGITIGKLWCTEVYYSQVVTRWGQRALKTANQEVQGQRKCVIGMCKDVYLNAHQARFNDSAPKLM